jgi:hypothetical protein
MNNAIPRRTFLKGVGATIALPLLEGMLPLRALASSLESPPLRVAFLFVPNGMDMQSWTPAAQGSGFQLSPTLSALEPVKGSINVLSGLAQKHAFAGPDGPGDHARSTAVWLTGVRIKKTAGADIQNGISVDQLAAAKVGTKTRFPSLELGCERGALAGDCDSGYSCAYSSSVSWKSATTPVAKEVNPRAVFERLFGTGLGSGDAGDLARREKFRQSILDFVLEDAASLSARLGTRDRRKIDEYLSAIREIERRIAQVELATQSVPGGAKPTGVPRDYGEHIRLLGDMMVLAFQTDQTRICTFMFANDGSNRSFSQIGVPEGHHDISHHGKDTTKIQKKQRIDSFYVEQLAYILRRMQEVDDVTGTLLDNSLLVYGAGISDGDRHNHDELPVLVAGKGGGTVKTGSHTRYSAFTPLNNLYVSMLDRMGIPGETLGDATGMLPGLF